MTSPWLVTLRARPRPRPRTFVVAFILFALLLVIGALATKPARVRLSAMEHFLQEMDVEMLRASVPPAPDQVAFLPSDVRLGDEKVALLDWVREGGRLILTDPDSGLLSDLGVSPSGDGGLFGTGSLRADCLFPETEDVATVVAYRSDRRLRTTEPGPQQCFGSSSEAYLVRVQEGEGVVLITGGDSFLSDELLGSGNNADLLMGMLAGRSSLTVLPSRPPIEQVSATGSPGETASSGSLWDTIPSWLQIAIWEVVIAGILFAAVRGRRLGMPPHEAPLVEIPASELVLATGALYQRSRDARHAGSVTRRWWIRRMQRRFGVPSEGSVPVESIASAAGDLAPRTVRELVEAPDPTDDERLLTLGKSLENITLTIEQGAKR